MSLSITDLFSPQTSDQIRASMVTNLIALGIPADKWNKGGVASTILTICSMAIALLSTMIAALIQGFFLPTATGNSLRLLAKYMYGVDIPDATFATGSVTLVNGGGVTFTLPAGSYTCLNSTTKAQYTNDQPFVLGPLGTLSVNVVALVAGSAGNAVVGAIDTNVTSLLNVTVTNPSSLVGVDTPTDAQIRLLCTNKLGALGVRGVRTAYAYAVQVAINPITNAPVNINRWSVSSASHTGDVEVIVASPSGAPDPNDVTGVATSVELLARPEGVTANVTGAGVAVYSPPITIWCTLPTGVTAATAKAACDAALLVFISTYPIGGVLANDDANPSIAVRALFASGVYGVLASALSSVGGVFVSGQGAFDFSYLSGQVATDAITTTLRVLSPTSGTTVS